MIETGQGKRDREKERGRGKGWGERRGVGAGGKREGVVAEGRVGEKGEGVEYPSPYNAHLPSITKKGRTRQQGYAEALFAILLLQGGQRAR